MFKRIIFKKLHLSDINPRICGLKDYEPGESVSNRRIERYVLHYVTGGRGIYLVDDRRWEVEEGEIFVSHPGEATTYVSDREQPMSYIWVSFDCAPAFAELLQEDIIPAQWAKAIFVDILQCSESAVPEWAVCGGLYRFFVGLAQRQMGAEEIGRDYVGRAAHYIQTNLSEDIRVADLAADLGLSRSYFCRLFKTQLGVSPQEYLVLHRLERAAVLMTEQNLSQKEAALRVGYEDICTFSRMFKRKYGISPGEYVKSHRQKNVT